MSKQSTRLDAVGQHYGTGQLENRVLQALQNARIDTQSVSWVDLAPLDQFHVRGLAATKEMAEALDPRAGATVLDIGCGLGGSARFLAANYGCRVTAIDLNKPFLDVARLLTEMTALDVTYAVMDALNLTFGHNSFDYVWTQHVAMNIRERTGFYATVHRVLKPGGRFGMYDVTAGDKGPLAFPVPWARTPDISFLLTQRDTRQALRHAGFAEVSWVDKTALGIQWFDEQQAARTTQRTQTLLGLHLVMGPEFRTMADNLGRNLKEGKVGLIQVIVEKPAGNEI